MLGGEAHVGQDIGLRVIQQGRELRHPWSEFTGDVPPLLRAATASSWANAVPTQAETMRRCVLPACAIALRMKCTRQRCQVAQRILLMAAFSPSWASDTSRPDPSWPSI